MNNLDNLNKLKKALIKKNIDAYLVPKNDFFFNEFIKTGNDRLRYVSNFTGSAGTALILHKKNYLFVDGRYTLQAKQESGHLFNIIDISKINILSFLKKNYTNIKIGFDPNLFRFQAIKNILKEKINLVSIEKNLIEQIWKDKKKEVSKNAFILENQYCGISHIKKIKKLRDLLDINKKNSFFISSNENVCWLLNIRGEDSIYSPLLNAFALIQQNKITVFCNLKKVSNKLIKSFKKDVQFSDIKSLKEKLIKTKIFSVKIDPATTSYGLIKFLQSSKIKCKFIQDPIFHLKSKKNKIEIQNLKIAHMFDGVALVKLFFWINQFKNKKKINEISCQKQLENFRKENSFYLGPSFPPISGFNKNGAIIHYNATNKTNQLLTGNGIYLLDTGGQYLWGTTDVTRTISLGKPSLYKKNIYTRILKGHLALRNFELKNNTTGAQLDQAARKYLKQIGLDYPHSTGHGVGYCLNVHENPPSISKKSKDKFAVGQVVSNEPGYYLERQFGMRIENLVYVNKIKKKLLFKDLTLVPYDKNLINKNLLSRLEIKYLNNYHKEVFEKLNSFLNLKELSFLKKICSPL
ncbi:MAG: aminopeptidase P family protein [Candidatus Pelagibacter sp.]|nr:aminopeptidase P family protein [Candidatus Pelagibacter sp.]